MLLGPFLGALHALCGLLLNAVATYDVGRRLGRDAIRRLAGERLNPITIRLARRGVPGVAGVRLLAVASFSVVNMDAGASRARLRDLLIGTALGMA